MDSRKVAEKNAEAERGVANVIEQLVKQHLVTQLGLERFKLWHQTCTVDKNRHIWHWK
jgi:hypothetical protein